MSWNPLSELHYVNNGGSYGSTGSFVDFFEGLTHDHVNFIFSGTLQNQDSFYPSTLSSSYKYGLSEQWPASSFDPGNLYMVNVDTGRTEEQREPFEVSSEMPNQQTFIVDTDAGRNTETSAQINTEECTHNNNFHDYQVVWQDSVDPDNMSYEELLELGDVVGTQSRGLSQDMISLIRISKYKCGFFWRKKSRDERCVICQLKYKRGCRQMILPCNHVYHVACGKRWLSINKACPICYTEVSADSLNDEEKNQVSP